MLERYQAILRGDELPRFVQAAGKVVSATAAGLAGKGIDGLWRIHEEALREPGDLEEAVDTGASLLDLKLEIARRLLSSCCLCEHRCLVDRAAGETGICGIPAESRYASEFLHFGEEPELVPSHTIFFTGCTFQCAYCQNWDIATRPSSGLVAEPSRLARAIDQGFASGSRNVNFVGGNPDSHLHTCIDILSRVESYIPVVWNSNAYASTETMGLLDGVVDIFLSDFRYGNDDCARRLSGVDGYLETIRRNLLLARDQAELMLRHLVLPGHLECCTEPMMAWVAEKLPDVYFNLMFQYRPVYRAAEYPEISRILAPEERRRARELSDRFGLTAV